MPFIQEAQRAVAAFHKATGQPVHRRPVLPDISRRNLRARLIGEESRESIQEIDSGGSDLAGELVDLIYVALGTAVEYGIELEPFFRAVHDANMAKVEGGVRRRPDGKILKPEGWQPADLEAVYQEQL